MNFKNKIVVLLLPLFMLACAGPQKKQPEIEEIFMTDIKENGIKFFSYSVAMNSPQKRVDGRGVGRRGGKGSGGSASDSTMNRKKERIHEKLKSKLVETGYCREGYIEIDSYLGGSQYQIRGECEEGATDSDRKIFVNQEGT